MAGPLARPFLVVSVHNGTQLTSQAVEAATIDEAREKARQLTVELKRPAVIYKAFSTIEPIIEAKETVHE